MYDRQDVWWRGTFEDCLATPELTGPWFIQTLWPGQDPHSTECRLQVHLLTHLPPSPRDNWIPVSKKVYKAAADVVPSNKMLSGPDWSNANMAASKLKW